ncbi:hypothetical protein KRP22_006212 [Phytophthora ramorum]|nr:PHD and RING finger domain-containing protein 1 [Phytophthora ramorum]
MTARFSWETAVQEDRDLLRIDTFVQRTIAKLPGQPAPRADTGRGSRYAPAASPTPAVKSEAMPNSSTAMAPGDSPQFIDPRDYQSESSSEYDMREVDPMDELSDFETETSQAKQRQEEQQQEEQQQEQEMDVEMDAAPQDKTQTVCEVCKSSERESEIVLCDDCDAEYHIFCLQPPLLSVPEEQWFCPKCSPKHPAVETGAVTVKAEQARASANGDPGTVQTTSSGVETTAATTSTTDASSDSMPASVDAPTGGADGNDPTSIPVAQALEGDPEKSNLLLIHACNCDDVKCTDPEFRVFCPHMKRFLRSVCWASHSDKWRSYRLARITAELFAYHAMNCTLAECNVPLCVKIREEEIV